MSSPSMSGIPREVEWRGKAVRTAIWKEPVHGSVLANRLNLIGDGASRSFRSRWRAASYHGLSARFLPLLRELSSPIRISVTAVSARISQSNDLPRRGLYGDRFQTSDRSNSRPPMAHACLPHFRGSTSPSDCCRAWTRRCPSKLFALRPSPSSRCIDSDFSCIVATLRWVQT
jgi:hypothetical protein